VILLHWVQALTRTRHIKSYNNALPAQDINRNRRTKCWDGKGGGGGFGGGKCKNSPIRFRKPDIRAGLLGH